MNRRAPRLSKTRFQGGLQCLKRVWLEHHRRDLATPPDAATLARFRAGHRVGKLARSRWPGGVLVEESAARHEAAVARTRALLADPSVPAIYEAAFTFAGVRIRADVLVRHDSGFELVEVKSSTKLKDEHRTDVAVQLWVLRGCGVEVVRSGLLHVDRGYVWPGGPYDPGALFALADVTEAALELQDEVGREVDRMLAVLGDDAVPQIEVGRHCDRPYTCPFKAHCWASVSPESDGAERIEVDALHAALDEIEWPVCFLDFETYGPVLPAYEGTRPYEPIPFQWSAHVLDAGGHVEHHEFLWTERSDPRPAFIRSLTEVVPDGGSIVVYSGYEEARLEALAATFPEEGEPLLESFLEQRVDLLAILRATVEHPGFGGSYSLKSVLPVLVPGMGYEGLAIGEGMEAAVAYEELVARGTEPRRRREIEQSLRAYCRRDTEATLRLFERLRRI